MSIAKFTSTTPALKGSTPSKKYPLTISTAKFSTLCTKLGVEEANASQVGVTLVRVALAFSCMSEAQQIEAFKLLNTEDLAFAEEINSVK